MTNASKPLTVDERWCLPGSKWGPGAYAIVEKHLAELEKCICAFAHGHVEDRTPDGPLEVTCDDARWAIENY